MTNLITASGRSHLEQLFARYLHEERWEPMRLNSGKVLWKHRASWAPTETMWACFPQRMLSLASEMVTVDFLFASLRTKSVDERFVVEVDGHLFHERTPEQASRDRARDRAFQLHGLGILRFTFTELTRYRDACIGDLNRAMQRFRPEGAHEKESETETETEGETAIPSEDDEVPFG